MIHFFCKIPRKAVALFVYLLEYFLRSFKFRMQINNHLIDGKLQINVLNCVVPNVKN